MEVMTGGDKQPFYFPNIANGVTVHAASYEEAVAMAEKMRPEVTDKDSSNV